MPLCKFGRIVNLSRFLFVRAINHSNLPGRKSSRRPVFNTRWKEWLALPIKYSDLPSSSQVAITIWDSAGPRKQVPFGGTTYSIFNPSDKFVASIAQLISGLSEQGIKN